MMRLIADTHVHTISSGHAHSTVLENVTAAREMGHLFALVTDHGPALPGAPNELYFRAQPNVLPRTSRGLYLLTGCEANVLGADGALDLPDKTLERLDWVIASMHTPCFAPSDRAAHTRAWLGVAENPNVDVLGHLGDARFDFDHETVIRACARTGKIVEINDHSFGIRPGSDENCPDIARLCARFGVPVVCSTDAHYADCVGHAEHAAAMLESIHFPEVLILNADAARFAQVLHQKTGRDFPVPS